ncbi:hypothetical protein D3C74_454720 [compost metagenome]
MAPAHEMIQLHKRLKQLVCSVFRNANAGIRNRKMQGNLSCRLDQALDFNRYTSGISELNRIANQIQQDLL